MKLEVGMYVRTKHYNHIPSYISKIIKITDDYVKLENQKDTHYSWEKEDILKASHNIIDLIEVGDYVNGYKVSLRGYDYADFVQCDYPVENGTTNHYKFYEQAIKSIVTKEQFSSMEYRLGDDK